MVAVLYDHTGTRSTLLAQVQRAVSGHSAQRLGLLAPGGTREVLLLRGRCWPAFSVGSSGQRVDLLPADSPLSEKTLLSRHQREFWKELSSWVVPLAEGGGIDIFSPLAAAGG